MIRDAAIILAVAAGAALEAAAQAVRRYRVKRRAIRVAAAKMGVDPDSVVWFITDEIRVTAGGKKRR